MTLTTLSPAAAHAAPGDTVTLPVSEALAGLPVQGEVRDGYSRDLFRHWVDADRDGCSTRAEVLLAEAVTAPAVGSGCSLTGGSWYSLYDSRTLTSATQLDIDHLVPLAESWDSGASGWTAGERQAFANDLDDPRSLIAVSAASNRSKSDQDPATWMPPTAAYHCEYVTTWVVVKTRWGLTVDEAERDALAGVLSQCPDTVVEVTLAR
ncbi:HNH endonuclease family protein [Streptomyces chilikensis]|uniref:HNH endonuclease family protein n=1 Tax=Streptomyces chilikensis TaxID=1194079 RepID=A0ABV3ERJ8_9ACTN